MEIKDFDNKRIMKIVKVIFTVFGVLLFIGIVNSCSNSNDNLNSETIVEEKEEKEENVEVVLSLCDGVSITHDCVLNDIIYETYKYHPEVAEVSHYEKKLAGYNDVVVGYCTLCNDGTRSPSCSTGRGTCSHHGGVREWNAPIYQKQPYYEDVKVIDVEARAAWYEMVVKEDN